MAENQNKIDDNYYAYKRKAIDKPYKGNGKLNKYQIHKLISYLSQKRRLNVHLEDNKIIFPLAEMDEIFKSEVFEKSYVTKEILSVVRENPRLNKKQIQKQLHFYISQEDIIKILYDNFFVNNFRWVETVEIIGEYGIIKRVQIDDTEIFTCFYCGKLSVQQYAGKVNYLSCYNCRWESNKYI